MKIRYQLKKKTNGTHLVYIALYLKDEQQIISTGVRCELDQWSKKNAEPKNHDSDEYIAVKKIETAVLKVKRLMEAHDKPVTPFTLKQEYLNTLKEKSEEQLGKDQAGKKDLASILALSKKFVKDLDSKVLAETTKKNCKSSIKTFQTFLSKKNLSSIERKDFNKDIIDEYASWLHKQKYRDSSHGKKMKDLREFLKYIEYDKHPLDQIKILAYKEGERNIIHLTEEELDKLEKRFLSFDHYLQKTKDMFLLGCYTGLRISDLKRIKKHLIINDSVCLTLHKNRKAVNIPLIKKAREILSRYDFAAPKIAARTVNDNLKVVCEKAGINSLIEFNSVKQGLLIQTTHKKFQKITTHSAGKTFISLAGDKWGLTPVEIAAIVGKDVRTIMAYYLKLPVAQAHAKIVEADNRAQMKKVS